MADLHLVQSELSSGHRKTIAYIEELRANVGLTGRLLDHSDPLMLWTVTKVFQSGTPVDYRKGIRQHRKRTGDAMPKSAPSASREPE